MAKQPTITALPALCSVRMLDLQVVQTPLVVPQLAQLPGQYELYVLEEAD